MKDYDVMDWYWEVEGNTTQVFSSASGTYVPLNDPNFVAWGTDGTRPARINSEASLGQVLAQALIRPQPTGILDGFTTALADEIVVRAVFRIVFNHENRLRAIERNLGLNGSPPNLTPAQARAAVKALM